jgi:hypothetical protein
MCWLKLLSFPRSQKRDLGHPPDPYEPLDGNGCRKGSQQRQPSVYCHRRKSKMEIPVKVPILIADSIDSGRGHSS